MTKWNLAQGLGSVNEKRNLLEAEIFLAFNSVESSKTPRLFVDFTEKTNNFLIKNIEIEMDFMNEKSILNVESRDISIIAEELPELTIKLQNSDNNPNDQTCFSSECWFWDTKTETCQLKPDTDGKCYRLRCFYDQMSIVMYPELFGTQIGESFPFGADGNDECLPKWNNGYQGWFWNHELGACGMDIARKRYK